MRYRFIPLCLCALLWSITAFAAVPAIPFTVTMSEAVNVTGSPRIVLDVDGNTRYALYSAGTGTASLTFTYTATAGDVDLNGIVISSTSVDLNGGTVTDLNGNALSNLTFTPPANMGSVNVNYPSLAMDFIADADGRYSLNGTVYNDLTSFLMAAGGTFSRGSTATYFDSSGVLQTAASGTPRFDHNPSTLVAKGLLIEESRTNLIPYSYEIDNSVWQGGGLPSPFPVVANVSTAPDGTSTADKGSVSAGAPTRRVILGGLTIGTVYTASVYVRAPSSGAAASFRLTTNNTSAWGTGGSTKVNLTTSWQRVTVSWTQVGTTAMYFYVGAVDTTSAVDATCYGDVEIWGAQLEQGTFETSFIPTTTAAVTRAADNLSLPVTGWYNQSEGLFYTQTQSPIATGSMNVGSTIYTTTNAAIDAGVFLRYRTLASNYTQGMVVSSNSNTISADVGTVTASTNKTAQALKTNDYAFYANGAQVNTDNVCTLQSGITMLYLSGTQPNVLSARANTTYEKFRYYPVRASNTQLQLLTQ